LTVDLMRHLPEVESGTMDYLFGKLLEWSKEQGYDTFNLGLSALSGVGDKPEDPLVERAIHFIYEHVDQFYNFKGLHAFKEKFRPHWEPRYLVYPGSPNLPQVWTALGRM
ncbi:MAG: phosphatidylglycerol lysyltransferase domain-containing protein, partial [Anaerolineae bacterium]